MSAWRYIPGRWWIFAIPLIVFLVVGTAILVAYGNGLRTPDTWFPMDEILFLGIFFIVFPPLFTFFLVFKMKKGNRREAELLRDGIKLEAVLLSMTETGTTVNNAPEIEMELSLELPDGFAMKVKHRCFVSLLDLVNLSPGNRLSVVMDPEIPDRMVVLTSKIPPESD